MNCSIVTPRVMRWLASNRPARVLNLFDEVCNLADEGGGVISLVSARIGQGPFSLVLDEDFTNGIDAQSAVAVDPSTHALMVGPLAITTDLAVVWNPIPDWQALRTTVSSYLANPPFLKKEINEPLIQLVRGIKDGSASECRSGAHRLAGLGQGLTPAGDDVLMGVLYGLWVWRPDEEWMRLIVDSAVPRTTTLSAAFLTAACDGEATIHWHNLANGCADAVDQIFSIGASSGRDAWAGFTHLGRHFTS